MIVRLAIRSLATRPLRTALLACGFGFGIAVMAALLGVGEVILAQSRSPALQGGGHIVVFGRFGGVESARFLLANVLGAPDVAPRIAAASPSRRERLFLIQGTRAIPVSAKGGVPSLEQAVGDPEVAGITSWRDRPIDRAWLSPAPGDLLRAMDRFHPVPDLPEFAGSWAEWLYFNGRTSDGRTRFYLTFMVGPKSSTPGKRSAGVRLQIDRDGKMRSYARGEEIDEARVLSLAPDLEIAGSRVRLDGLRYVIDLALPGASGSLVLESGGHSLPPASIQGARGWISGYTAPVLTGRLNGSLEVERERVVFENAVGYHDHNWGFWEGVRWQWGQVAHGDLSFVYGRVYPPRSVADVDRIPGFLGVMGPNGPLAFSTAVTIEEPSPTGDSMGTAPRQRGDSPHVSDRRTVIRARGSTIDLELAFTAERTERTAMSMTASASGPALDFLQMSGEYLVKGRIGDRDVEFRARGAAERFEPRQTATGRRQTADGRRGHDEQGEEGDTAAGNRQRAHKAGANEALEQTRTQIDAGASGRQTQTGSNTREAQDHARQHGLSRVRPRSAWRRPRPAGEADVWRHRPLRWRDLLRHHGRRCSLLQSGSDEPAGLSVGWLEAVRALRRSARDRQHVVLQRAGWRARERAHDYRMGEARDQRRESGQEGEGCQIPVSKAMSGG